MGKFTWHTYYTITIILKIINSSLTIIIKICLRLLITITWCYIPSEWIWLFYLDIYILLTVSTLYYSASRSYILRIIHSWRPFELWLIKFWLECALFLWFLIFNLVCLNISFTISFCLMSLSISIELFKSISSCATCWILMLSIHILIWFCWLMTIINRPLLFRLIYFWNECTLSYFL